MLIRTLVVAFSLYLTSALVSAQTPEPSKDADGLIHVTLTLGTKAVSIDFPPNLADTEASHQQLLSGVPGARARVGTLTAHRALRIGSLSTDPEEPPPPREEGEPAPELATHELWLHRNVEGWELEAHQSDSTTINIIPLSHDESDSGVLPTFSASFHATAAEAGRLKLRWGRHAWTTAFRFDELPPPPRQPRVSGNPRENEYDTNTSAFARRVTLNERNENVVVLPDGNQIVTLYWKDIDVDDEDYGRLQDTENGAVVSLIHAPPLRIRSDVNLRFGDVDVPVGNLAPGFAGSYALWLQKTDSGWRFVFNNEPDSWGTQHDPEFDAAEFDVHYARTADSFRPLGIALVLASETTGSIVVHWGPHEWSAPFTVTR